MRDCGRATAEERSVLHIHSHGPHVHERREGSKSGGRNMERTTKVVFSTEVSRKSSGEWICRGLTAWSEVQVWISCTSP